jgi:uncharacterized membrane protein YgdD (TMEM256/DUF423 family)
MDMKLARVFLFLGAVNALIAVVAGALGSHALKEQLSVGQPALFQTAIQYHMFHAAGLLVIGVVAALRPPSALLAWAGALMFVGIVLFCGSLYVGAITDLRGASVVAPLGGVAFIVSWILLAAASVKS